MSTTRRPPAIALVLALAVLAAGCAVLAGTAAGPAVLDAPRGNALAAASRLAVKGRAPRTGYSRDQFGEGWASLDGCHMREVTSTTSSRSATRGRRAPSAGAVASA